MDNQWASKECVARARDGRDAPCLASQLNANHIRPSHRALSMKIDYLTVVSGLIILVGHNGGMWKAFQKRKLCADRKPRYDSEKTQRRRLLPVL